MEIVCPLGGESQLRNEITIYCCGKYGDSEARRKGNNIQLKDAFMVIIAITIVILLFGVLQYNRNSKGGIKHNKITYPKSLDDINFLIPNGEICNGSILDIIVIVISGVDRIQQRQLVRETWASNLTEKQKLVFIMGKTAVSFTGITEKIDVNEENTVYGDIVQADFEDTYWNLTIKSVLMVKWAAKYCPSAKYVMKTDDDVFVNVNNLVYALQRTSTVQDKFFLCRVMYFSLPIRSKSHRWFVPETDWPETFYPNYCIGGGYSWTNSISKKLYEAHRTLPIFKMEDIYLTGIIARHVGIPRIGNHLVEADFHYTPPNYCEFRDLISYHGLPKERWRSMWRDIQTMQPLCWTAPFLLFM